MSEEGRLHCGVPVPGALASADEWAAFNAQVERNLRWLDRVLALQLAREPSPPATPSEGAAPSDPTRTQPDVPHR